MNHLERTILSAALGLAMIQILPLQPRTNPAIRRERTIEANLEVPPPVQSILNTACKDCHSHETRWPWYAGIAPLSWIIAGDVERAREALNLSDWTLRPQKAIGALMAACAGAQGERMPPAAYRAMHPEARLSSEQIDTLCGWTMTEARTLRRQTLHASAWRKF